MLFDVRVAAPVLDTIGRFKTGGQQHGTARLCVGFCSNNPKKGRVDSVLVALGVDHLKIDDSAHRDKIGLGVREFNGALSRASGGLNQVRISAVLLAKVVPVYRRLATLHGDIRNRKNLGDRVPIPGRNE